ncbi:MAG TPA: peptidyl-tRNA hydrolase, partial [Phycisphaerae bacterium]|nr:peptidyl-tRNA hydrolase [Phycisphaerae bacterium]
MNENDDSIAGRIVVGLGNPGRKYARTRHNVGFRVLRTLVNQWVLGDGREAFEGLTWDVRRTRGGEVRRVMMLTPMTYMNCSGRSVQAMLKYYKVRTGETLVVLDDLALPLGQLRIRSDGSGGGHNGLEDVLQACGTNEVPR